MIEEIPPCPFCNSAPHISKFSNKWSMDCEEKTCPVQPVLRIGYPTKKDAIEAWGYRTCTPIKDLGTLEFEDGMED